MEQMYKVFCDNRSIRLVNHKDYNGSTVDDAAWHEKALIPSAVLIIDWLEGRILSDLLLSSEGAPDQFVKAWAPNVKIVEAAGGVVWNDKKEPLFIFRNHFWDLPKGHVDPGETHLETALREVEEETGLSGFRLGRQLPDSWHFYFMRGSWCLKHTCWYEMFYSGTVAPKPQFSEGITQVKWIARKNLSKTLDQSYRSVQEVLGGWMLHQP